MKLPDGIPYEEYESVILAQLSSIPELEFVYSGSDSYYKRRFICTEVAVSRNRAKLNSLGEDGSFYPPPTAENRKEAAAAKLARILSMPLTKAIFAESSTPSIVSDDAVRSTTASNALTSVTNSYTENVVSSKDFEEFIARNSPAISSSSFIHPTYRQLFPSDGRSEENSDGLVDFCSVSSEAEKLSPNQSLWNCEQGAAFMRGYSLSTDHKAFEEYALLGRLPMTFDEVYLNIHEPFSMIAVGLQGSGKSHTLSCIMESCLIPLPGVIRLKQPMTTLVLHYDSNPSSVCEATGLIEPSSAIPWPTHLRRLPHVDHDKMVVLVSPSYYKQRKAFYGDYCTVKPLLLRWSTMTADHIKKIMGIQDSDNQLYIAGLLHLLRKYQREDKIPNYNEFIIELKSICKLKGQSGPLDQRLRLLSSIVAESEDNEGVDGTDVFEACHPGTLVIVDHTDPLLSSSEVNGIFQILIEQFRASPSASNGKLLVVDEAHKYMSGKAGDGLSAAIVNISRLIRHDGIRLIVSTQSPFILAPELLELSTLAFLHRFHSPDWFEYLKRKLPLKNSDWDKILQLGTGAAVVYASKHLMESTGEVNIDGSACISLDVRGKLTSDRGKTMTNRACRVLPSNDRDSNLMKEI